MGLFDFRKKKGATPSQQAGPVPNAPPDQSSPALNQEQPVEPLPMQTPAQPAESQESSQLFTHPAEPAPVQSQVPPVQSPSVQSPVQPAPVQMDFSVPDFSDDDLSIEPQAAPTVQSQVPPVQSPSVQSPVQLAPASPVTSIEPQMTPQDQPAPTEPQAAATEASVSDQLNELSSAIDQSQEQFNQDTPFTQTTPIEQASEEAPVEEGDVSVSEPVNPTEFEYGDEFGLEQSASEPEPEDDGMSGLSFAADHELAPIMPAEEPAQEAFVQESIPQETMPQAQFSDQQSAPTTPVVSVPYDEPEPIDGKVFVQRNKDRTDVFVEKGAYEDALLSMMAIEEDVSKAADHLGRVIDDESIVSARMSEWHDVMNEIQERLITVDSRIFDVGDTNG